MPVGPFFADFFCREKRLIVELDGHSHDVQPGRDEARDRYLYDEGYLVLRFANAEVHANVEGVVTAIEIALGLQAHPQPLPQAGGE